MGGAGKDTVLGAEGNDYINGSDGDDFVFGGDGDDIVIGDLGNDYLNGENGNNIVFGGAGNDTVIGGFGDDYLDGGTGDDILTGGIGNDTLFASSGNDYLRGDAGVDFFIFAASFGKSLVIDFAAGTRKSRHHPVQRRRLHRLRERARPCPGERRQHRHHERCRRHADARERPSREPRGGRLPVRLNGSRGFAPPSPGRPKLDLAIRALYRRENHAPAAHQRRRSLAQPGAVPG